jgi:HSP20 family protein
MALPTRVRGYVDPMEQVHREFDHVINRLFNPANGAGANETRWAPYAVDVREDADHFYVEAELPGFRKDDVEITLENQTLTISAERKETEEKKGDFLLNERRYTRFLRTFAMPPTVDEKHVDAKLNDGILTLTLKKREETKPRKITVS